MCVYLCVDSLFLSLPSAAGGEIFDHCVSEELLPEVQITRMIRQTLEGVHYLHQSNLVHLDLKVLAHSHAQNNIHAAAKVMFAVMFAVIYRHSAL